MSGPNLFAIRVDRLAVIQGRFVAGELLSRKEGKARWPSEEGGEVEGEGRHEQLHQPSWYLGWETER